MSGGRLALRFEPNDSLDITFGALMQNTRDSGHGDINVDSADLEQVRFSKENMDDDGTSFH